MPMIEQIIKPDGKYYPTMYRDGYSPQQIMETVHREMYNEFRNRKGEEAVPVLPLKLALEKAMNDIFKEWK